MIRDFFVGRFPEPDPLQPDAINAQRNISLNNWLELRGRPVVLWGWAPQEGNTMCFEHESLRRAFRYLGFDTHWFSSNEDPDSVLANLPSPRIYITGNEGVGAKIVPHIRSDDIVIVHNEFEISRWQCKVFPYGQYCTPSTCYPGITLPYPTDLLPHEYDPVCLQVKENELACFIGSPYSTSFMRQHEELKGLFASIGVAYEFTETWNPSLVHKIYSVCRWMPVPQLPDLVSFLPSRFCKSMARGCIPLSINPLVKVLLGKGAEACVFGNNWQDVARQVLELKANPELMHQKSMLGMQWARGLTALHFLEYLWPAPEKTRPSNSYWEIRENILQGNDQLRSRPQLELLLERYPDNRLVMFGLGLLYRNLGLRQEQRKLFENFKNRFPDDIYIDTLCPA